MNDVVAALEGTITWDERTRSYEVKVKGRSAVFGVDAPIAVVDTRVVTLSAPVRARNRRRVGRAGVLREGPRAAHGPVARVGQGDAHALRAEVRAPRRRRRGVCRGARRAHEGRPEVLAVPFVRRRDDAGSGRPPLPGRPPHVAVARAAPRLAARRAPPRAWGRGHGRLPREGPRRERLRARDAAAPRRRRVASRGRRRRGSGPGPRAGGAEGREDDRDRPGPRGHRGGREGPGRLAREGRDARAREDAPGDAAAPGIPRAPDADDGRDRRSRRPRRRGERREGGRLPLAALQRLARRVGARDRGLLPVARRLRPRGRGARREREPRARGHAERREERGGPRPRPHPVGPRAEPAPRRVRAPRRDRAGRLQPAARHHDARASSRRRSASSSA